MTRSEFLALGLASLLAPPAIAQEVGFNRHVRPILARHCFQCHGPDERARESGLRLDTREGALAPAESGLPAIVLGDSAASELFRRIGHADAGERMPPKKADSVLTPEEIETIRRWIDAGAVYEPHWSLTPARVSDPPRVSDPEWVRNPIDAFVMARLDGAGLTPRPEADRRTLIRRLSLDLTGIPPTPEEAAAFEADDSPGAYERLVDRLLDTDRHAERMALEWMDVARYADTNGYHIDNERFMWRWRDWVIGAYRANMAFDRFTIEQIAGDLLPGATTEQVIASGFHRNHMINFEGGAIPEEYLNNYLVDRVNTTATAWLGMTMSCAQCHDHKYDPITQEDYYRFYAFFNSVPEKGLDGNTGNAEPFIDAPLPEQAGALEEARARVASLEAELNAPMPEADAAQSAWERAMLDAHRRAWTPARPSLAAAHAIGGGDGATLSTIENAEVVASGASPARSAYEFTFEALDDVPRVVRLEALTPEGGPGPGRFENGNFVLTGLEAEAWASANPGQVIPLGFGAAVADFSQVGFDVSRAIDTDASTGWAVLPAGGVPGEHEAWFALRRHEAIEGPVTFRLRLRFESIHERHSFARVRVSFSSDADLHASLLPAEFSTWRAAGPFPSGTTSTGEAFEIAHEPEVFAPDSNGRIDAGATYLEGTLAWADRPDLVDGVANATPCPDYSALYFTRTVKTDRARRISLALGSDDGIKVWLNGAVVHTNPVARALAPDQDRVELDLPPGESTILVKVVNYQGNCGLASRAVNDDALEAPLDVLRAIAGGSDAPRVRAYFRARHSPEYAAARTRLDEAGADLARVRRSIPTTMVMSAPSTPSVMRPTRLLIRGEYDKPDREVSPGVPRLFDALTPAADGSDRLALARWLVSPEHPLTARVQVNRLWQMVFGTGLVRTAEDFGVQGEWPTHPELLDHLATEFVASGWDTRHILRLIATSAAYRQDAVVTREALAVDPENRLLSRHPRLRLSAEGIRDNALAISGLLVERVGGPSVRVYHPPGLWEEMAIDPDGSEFSAQVYVQDTGESLYRRGLYVFRKRSVPHPSMQVFDAPSREICVVRRLRTNTPLQALVLMNDPTFVEAARRLAQRVILAEPGDAGRAALMWELATLHPILVVERDEILALVAEQRAAFGADPESARSLLGVGDSPRDESIDPGEHAAWTMAASAVLNLDRVICKE